VNNREVAAVFDLIADLLEIKGEQVYKVLAYRRAAQEIGNLGRSLQTLWEADELRTIPGVGEAIASKIDELLRTGKLEFAEKLAAEVPPGLVEVLKVEGVGPRKAARFWKDLGITTLADLEQAARAGKLRGMPGMGARSEERILKGIESLRRRQVGRVSIGRARPVALSLLAEIERMPSVHRVELAGSLRRWRETVGDIDLLVAAEDAAQVIRLFAGLPQVDRVLGQGDTKVSVELQDGLRAQVWVHPPERFGSALQYATGSQAHNVRLRELAQQRGLSLSEHGFKKPGGGEILCDSEEEVYRRLGLPWVPPELREDRGEIQAAQRGQLPELVGLDDLAGELHAHSTWSDGQNSIEEMARAAMSLGLRYLVISDHSQSLGVANGLSIERLRRQAKEIETVQRRIGAGLRLLRGTEVEIRADGALDYPDDVLRQLDVVTASMHTSLRQSPEKVTARLLGAIRNPNVDVIGHPTGRMVEGREPAEVDIEAILREARQTGVALEINAHPARLDLDEANARRAAEMGCLLAINVDAHSPSDFELREYGVGVARRGWVPPGLVVNTWPVDRLEAWLQRWKQPGIRD